MQTKKTLLYSSVDTGTTTRMCEYECFQVLNESGRCVYEGELQGNDIHVNDGFIVLLCNEEWTGFFLPSRLKRNQTADEQTRTNA